MNKSALVNFNELSQEVGRTEFILNLRASPLNTCRRLLNLSQIISLDSTFKILRIYLRTSVLFLTLWLLFVQEQPRIYAHADPSHHFRPVHPRTIQATHLRHNGTKLFMLKFCRVFCHVFLRPYPICIGKLKALHFKINGLQGVTKICRLSWLTNSDLVYEPKCGGRGVGSQPMSTTVHMEPKYTFVILLQI